MNLARHPATLRLATLAFAVSTLSHAQTPAPPPAPTTQPSSMNRNVIVLDASHGGIDSGSRIGDTILEKDITLALAFKLRSLLTARGFTVVMTRDSDAATLGTKPLTLDDRAGLANSPRAAACLLLHATGAGNGVHLYTSDITPAPYEVALLPWLTAQAAWAPQSHYLAQQIANALQKAGIAYVNSTASVRPVDSLTCPAVIVELAPESDDPESINGSDYQQRVAQAIAAALVFWPKQVQPPARLVPASTPKPDTAKPDAVPSLKPTIPAEVKP